MKKYLSLLFALLLACSVLAAIAFAAGEDEGISTPDDAFDGNYTEFEGEDGSVTRVFDNGSVSTKSKDGSVTAVDYKGNQYSEDKDGNSTIRTTGGYVATEYKDGRQSLTEPNGKTTTVNPDGSFSESYGVGLTLDYNADGGLTGIGITGDDQRIETDENGCYKNGEITGPDGSKLTITDSGLQFVNREGTSYDHSDLGDRQTTSIQWKDGTHAEADTTVTWNGGEKTESTEYSLTDAEGNRWDSSVSTTYDADGKPYYVGNNVTQWTGADGSTLWLDNNTKAVQYNDKDGNKLITDENGNLLEYNDGKNAWNVTYDESGNVVSADITYSDGAKMVKNPDGTASFTLPDGTKYESDGSGNVYQDGEQIKQGGELIDNSESANAAPDKPNTDESNCDETSTDEPNREDPPERPAGAPSGHPLSIDAIAGTYHITGFIASEDFEDESFSGMEHLSLDLTVSAKGENTLVLSAEDGSSVESVYDPSTGSCTLTDEDGMTVYVRFSEKAGVYSVSLDFEETFPEARMYGSFSGTKQ